MNKRKLLSTHSILLPQLPWHERPQRAAPGVGIFQVDVVHSIPGDLVDLPTRNGTFAFLEDLHETGRLCVLCCIPRLAPRGTSSKDFGDSLKAILALAERYPAQFPPLYIQRAFAQIQPALLVPRQAFA